MRKLLLPIALASLAGLTGCVGYGGGTYGTAVYDNGYGYGSYGYGSSPYYGSGAAVVIQSSPSYRYYGGRDGYRSRDRDGDGVPNRYDSRPDNPRRY